MSNEASARKRMTFQGLINADKQKIPQRSSRSRSKSRSKASSITKSVSVSQLTSRTWRKVQARTPTPRQHSETSNPTTDNIFREKKPSQYQELMKKIIKLKNHAIKIQNCFRQQQSLQNNQSTVPKCSSENKEDEKLEQMQNFLQEFDAEIRKQTKQIGEAYIKQLQERDQLLQKQQFIVPEYKFITLPSLTPHMPNLEAKLKDMESKWKI